MPAAPPCRTLKPFRIRPGLRWHATILPANRPAGAGLLQVALLYGAAEASTTGNGLATPVVIETPVRVAAVPSDEPGVSVEVNARFWVDAATVVTHGERWSVVAAPGPELPAEAATTTPAL